MKKYLWLFIIPLGILLSGCAQGVDHKDRVENHMNNDLKDPLTHQLYQITLNVPTPIYYDSKTGEKAATLGIILIKKNYFTNNGEPYFNVTSSLIWDWWHTSDSVWLGLSCDGDYTITQNMIDNPSSEYKWNITSISK